MDILDRNWAQHKNGFMDRLELALAVKGLKQADLARELGISRAAVSRWFTEQPNLSSSKIDAVFTSIRQLVVDGRF